jgi:tetratricopeptide (TPR) repeat protein
MESNSEVAAARRELQRALRLAAIGESEPALRVLDCALVGLRSQSSRDDLAHAARHAGILCQQLGRMDLAVQYFEEALAANVSAGWDALALAMCHEQRGDDVSVRKYLALATRWATDAADDELISIVSNRKR